MTTDLVAAGANSSGDVWLAGVPAPATSDVQTGAAPLLPVSDSGEPMSCPGFDDSTFTLSGGNAQAGWQNGFEWQSLSVFPDGSALAGGLEFSTTAAEPGYLTPDAQPVVVEAKCGEAPIVTTFLPDDPFAQDQSTAVAVPADNDYQGQLPGSLPATEVIAANASNDAWLATSQGQAFDASGYPETERAYLYRYTDGTSPDAPSGDDNEARPSLFAPDPVTYIITPPPVVVVVGASKTVVKKRKTTTVKLKPAVYDVGAKLDQHTLILTITFRLRRPVTIGIVAYKGKAVVASSGMHHFKGRTGTLTLTLSRTHWPTKLSFKLPKT